MIDAIYTFFIALKKKTEKHRNFSHTTTSILTFSSHRTTSKLKFSTTNPQKTEKSPAPSLNADHLTIGPFIQRCAHTHTSNALATNRWSSDRCGPSAGRAHEHIRGACCPCAGWKPEGRWTRPVCHFGQGCHLSGARDGFRGFRGWRWCFSVGGGFDLDWVLTVAGVLYV